MRVRGNVFIAEEYLRLEKVLKPAVELNNGLYEPDDILGSLISGEYQLFSTGHSALVSTVIQYPRKSGLHIFLAGGNLKELEELYQEAEEFARYMNCSVITLLGRFGWKKSFLTNYNMKPTCLQMIKEL